MDERTRNFLAGALRGCQQLSECKSPESALIARGEDIISTAYSVETIPGKGFLNSPIIDAIIKAYTTSDIRLFNISQLCLFSTCFPSEIELKALHSSKIKSIYFFGDITDTNCVKFFNAHSDHCDKIGREDLKFNVVKLS